MSPSSLFSTDRLFVSWLVGARDFTSLPEDAVPPCGHTERSQGRQRNAGEAAEESNEANQLRAGRETGQRAEGCEICGMLCTHTGLSVHL